MDVAAACENEVVILGAFGCGAFKNKPEVVASIKKLISSGVYPDELWS